MKTLNEQYRLIKNDKGHKDVFLKEAKRIYPNFITNSSTFNEASKILKNKGIINENFVGLAPINNPFGNKKQEGYEKAFENFIKEAAEVKAEEKKVSKEVEKDQERAYDNKDKKDPNNMIFGQIQSGYYCELKDPKNADKTEQEIKDIVFKNLAKDPIYYTTNGQFGEEGVGYTDEAVSLGIPKEPKGPHKSSGYGTLKESKLLKEYTDDDFSGAELISRVNKPDMFGQQVFDEFFPMGSRSEADAIKALKAHDRSGIKARMGRYAPMFVHVQYHDFQDQAGEKYRVHQKQYYNSNFKDQDPDFNPSVTHLYLTKLADPDNPSPQSQEDIDLGTMLTKTDEYIKDLKNLDISKRSMEESLNEHSISTVGGIVTGTGFVGMDYREYYGLDEGKGDTENTDTILKNTKEIEKINKTISNTPMFEEDDITPDSDAPEHMEAVADAVEMAYEAGMSTAEIIEFVEMHLGLKMGDY